MFRPVLPVAATLLALAAIATPALADTGQGRWECVAYGAVPATDPNAPPPAPPADAPIDPQTGKPLLMPQGLPPEIPHGLLTIYAGSYTYASAEPDDPASGEGDAQVQPDGLVSFLNGALVTGAGVQMGKIETGATTLTMELIAETGTVYTCAAR